MKKILIVLTCLLLPCALTASDDMDELNLTEEQRADIERLMAGFNDVPVSPELFDADAPTIGSQQFEEVPHYQSQPPLPMTAYAPQQPPAFLAPLQTQSMTQFGGAGASILPLDLQRLHTLQELPVVPGAIQIQSVSALNPPHEQNPLNITQSNKFPCLKCSASFPTRRGYSSHMRNKHTVAPEDSPSKDMTEAQVKSAVMQLMATVKDNKKQKCPWPPGCPSILARYNLENHCTEVHYEFYLCSKCNTRVHKQQHKNHVKLCTGTVAPQLPLPPGSGPAFSDDQSMAAGSSGAGPGRRVAGKFRISAFSSLEKACLTPEMQKELLEAKNPDGPGFKYNGEVIEGRHACIDEICKAHNKVLQCPSCEHQPTCWSKLQKHVKNKHQRTTTASTRASKTSGSDSSSTAASSRAGAASQLAANAHDEDSLRRTASIPALLLIKCYECNSGKEVTSVEEHYKSYHKNMPIPSYGWQCDTCNWLFASALSAKLHHCFQLKNPKDFAVDKKQPPKKDLAAQRAMQQGAGGPMTAPPAYIYQQALSRNAQSYGSCASAAPSAMAQTNDTHRPPYMSAPMYSYSESASSDAFAEPTYSAQDSPFQAHSLHDEQQYALHSGFGIPPMLHPEKPSPDFAAREHPIQPSISAGAGAGSGSDSALNNEDEGDDQAMPAAAGAGAGTKRPRTLGMPTADASAERPAKLRRLDKKSDAASVATAAQPADDDDTAS